MKILPISKISFKSKSKELRNLDDYCRKFKAEYDGFYSTSKHSLKKDILEAKYGVQFESFEDTKRLDEKLYKMRLSLGNNAFDKFLCPNSDIYEEIVSQYRCANCGELATILKNRLQKEGIETNKIAMTIVPNESDHLLNNELANFGIIINKKSHRKLHDHVFLLYNEKTNSDPELPETWGSEAIIMDPWLGIVDRADSALRKIKTVFNIDSTLEKLVFSREM